MSRASKLTETLHAIADLATHSPGGVRIGQYQGLWQATIYPNGVNDIQHRHFEDATFKSAIMKAHAFVMGE